VNWGIEEVSNLTHVLSWPMSSRLHWKHFFYNHLNDLCKIDSYIRRKPYFDTDYTGSCKLNYYEITMMAPEGIVYIVYVVMYVIIN